MKETPIIYLAAKDIVLAQDQLVISNLLRDLVGENIYTNILVYKDSVIKRVIERMKSNYKKKLNLWLEGERDMGKYKFYYRYYPSQIFWAYRYTCYVCGENLSEQVKEKQLLLYRCVRCNIQYWDAYEWYT